MITESDAKQFQILFEEETGEKISLEESFEIAENLADMIREVYKPIKKSSGMCTKNESTT